MWTTRRYLAQARERHRQLSRQAGDLPDETRGLVERVLAEFGLALSMLEAEDQERRLAAEFDVPGPIERDVEEVVLERNFYRALLERVPGVLTLLAPDGSVRYRSPFGGRGLGFEPEDVLGRDGFEAVHPSERAEARECFETLLSEPGGVAEARVRCRAKDGSWHEVEVLGANALDDPILGGVLAIAWTEPD